MATGSWLDTLFAGGETIGPLAYGQASTMEPAGWHHGVDVIPNQANAALMSPVVGVYDPRDSGAYRVAISTTQGEVLFAHLRNALYGQGAVSVSRGMNLGQVLQVNPQSGKPFSQDQNYNDPAGGWYAETAPHIHVEADPMTGQPVGSGNVENPALFNAAATGQPGPWVPVGTGTGVNDPYSAIGATAPLPGSSTVPAGAPGQPSSLDKSQAASAAAPCAHSVSLPAVGPVGGGSLCLDGLIRFAATAGCLLAAALCVALAVKREIPVPGIPGVGAMRAATGTGTGRSAAA